MSAHAVPPDSVSFALLNACGETPLTTAEVATRAGVSSGNHAILYRLYRSGFLAHGPQVPGRRVPNVTWVRTPAGDETLRRSSTRLTPVQAHILTHLSSTSQRSAMIPCPEHLTRAHTPANWRGVRCAALRQLADQGLIDWTYGSVCLTSLGLATLPDARVRLGLPGSADPALPFTRFAPEAS